MIRVLPESDGQIVGVQASGTLTAEDYEKVWIPALQSVIAREGKVRVLLYLDATFEGWDAGAMWEDAMFGVKNVTKFEKIALVGGPEWVARIVGIVGVVIPADVKSFDGDELEEAWNWVR
ncbi:MAG: STAS/SEC14 domain-containing protein [Myxococcales bacterium]|jgi:hypothetical protein|nr:MAG: STAS/SEC14 domain-containing protein [Myxococcales bacterium]